MAIKQKIGILKLSKYINHTSFGMSMAALAFSEVFCLPQSRKDSSTWRHVSAKEIDIGGCRPEKGSCDPTGNINAMVETPLIIASSTCQSSSSEACVAAGENADSKPT